MERFERIGLQIMNRARPAARWTATRSAACSATRAKRSAAAQILGQAYLTAVCCMRHNREAVAERRRRAGRSTRSSTATRSSSCSSAADLAAPDDRRPRREHLAQGMSESDDRDQHASGPGIRPARSPSTIRRRCCPQAREPLLPPDADVVESDAVDEDARRPAARAPPRGRRARRRRRRGSSAYAPRFQFLTGALVGVGIAALVGVAVADRRHPAGEQRRARRGRRGSRRPAASRAPRRSPSHVGPSYR